MNEICQLSLYVREIASRMDLHGWRFCSKVSSDVLLGQLQQSLPRVRGLGGHVSCLLLHLCQDSTLYVILYYCYCQSTEQLRVGIADSHVKPAWWTRIATSADVASIPEAHSVRCPQMCSVLESLNNISNGQTHLLQARYTPPVQLLSVECVNVKMTRLQSSSLADMCARLARVGAPTPTEG